MIELVERTVRTVLDLPESFELRPELKLYDDLGADSLLLMAVIVGIETELGAEFSAEAIGRIRTIGDLLAEVRTIRQVSETG